MCSTFKNIYLFNWKAFLQKTFWRVTVGKAQVSLTKSLMTKIHFAASVLGAGFTKTDFDYGLDVTNSQTSVQNSAIAQSCLVHNYLQSDTFLINSGYIKRKKNQTTQLLSLTENFTGNFSSVTIQKTSSSIKSSAQCTAVVEVHYWNQSVLLLTCSSDLGHFIWTKENYRRCKKKSSVPCHYTHLILLIHFAPQHCKQTNNYEPCCLV